MPITVESAPDILAGLVATSERSETLANNCAVVRYEQRAEEQGHPLLITYWSVAQPLPPNHARVATFSYTMRAHQRNDPQFNWNLICSIVRFAQRRLRLVWQVTFNDRSSNKRLERTRHDELLP